jgi:metallophosphoesterase (TIGR03767 family)
MSTHGPTAKPARPAASSGVLAVAIAVALALTAVGSAAAHPGHGPTDTAGHTTREQTIVGDDPSQGFSTLRFGPGEPYVVRNELAAPATPGERRRARRISLAYFGQITDWQLADEQSPAREERTDAEPWRRGLGSSGFRPQEAMTAYAVDATIRQLNRFLRSPVRQAGRKRARLMNAVMTGDLADNMQRNETEWVMELLRGGTVQQNSGSRDPEDFEGTYCEGMDPDALPDPEGYVGVQNYDNYSPPNPVYYDPNRPIGGYGDWPRYPGLLDRAKRPFRAQGLRVPSYVAFGNHDTMYQGTISAFPPVVSTGTSAQEVAVDCLKPVYPFTDAETLGGMLNPEHLAEVLESDQGSVMLVPPDKDRQFVDRRQFKEIFDPSAPGSGAEQPDAHGFAYVDPEEEEASDGNAAYYSFAPAPGLRFIVLDTVSKAGVLTGVNRNGQQFGGQHGRIDNPQFEWLERELERASDSDELVTVFGHHARTSLINDNPDELNPCTGIETEFGNDHNPSCDGDPRDSRPIHLGDDLIALFVEHPNVLAYVAGHSHHHRVAPYCKGTDPDAPLEPPCDPDGGHMWEIKAPAVADWPPQHRLIEVMDNRDGTLSLIGTVLDHQAPTEIPESETDASGFGREIFAALHRVFAYNDPGKRADNEDAEGEASDRNVELLLPDPRPRRLAREGLPPPTTEIVRGPRGRHDKRRATFGFRTNAQGATFRCKLNRRPWRPCASPTTYRKLPAGRNVFRVRAVDSSGHRRDPGPAKRVFRVTRGR